MAIKHKFVSPQPDDPNAPERVQASNWNDTHEVEDGSITEVMLDPAVQSKIDAALSNVEISAGIASGLMSQLVFSNSNNVTFGLSGSTITASVSPDAAQSNQTLGVYASSNTTLTSSGTMDARSLSVRAIGSLTAGFSNGELLLSAPNAITTGMASNRGSDFVAATAAFAGTNVSGTIASNGISVSASVQTIGLYASSNTTLTSSGTQDARSLSFRAVGSLTVGYSSGEVILSAPNAITTAMASNRGTDFVAATAAFAGTNASGTINSTGISVSVAADAPQSAQTVGWYASSNTTLTSSGTADARSLSVQAIGSITAGFSNGILLLSAPNAITTADLSQNSSKYAGINGAITGGSITVNTSGVSVNVAAQSAQTIGWYGSSNTTLTSSGTVDGRSLSVQAIGSLTVGVSSGILLLSAPNAITTAMASNAGSNFVNTSAGVNLTNISATFNSNSISLSVGAYITTADLSQNSSDYFRNWKLTGNTAGTTSSKQGTDFWLAGGNGITVSGSSNSISISAGNYITTARASTDALGLNTAQTNVTWTANSSGLSINAAGYAGTNTNITGNASITLNSSGLSFNGSGLAGTSTAATNASLTLNSAGLNVNVPLSTISSYENMEGLAGGTTSMSFNGVSQSHAIAFMMPRPGSFSFLRFPVLMTTNSTTVASSNNLSTGGGFVYSTWNAVAYSLGVGASSNSLQSFASGSMGCTMSNSFSFNTANSGWSVSQGFTFNASGVQTSVSTQYSATSASLNVSTNFLTNCSSLRWMDINFANSLSAGAYWLVFGYKSSSTTSGQSGGPLTNAGVSYSNHYGVSQLNSWFEVLNNTAGSSGGYLGAGSFSTNAAATTASLALSNISSSVGNNRPYFQLLRSA